MKKIPRVPKKEKKRKKNKEDEKLNNKDEKLFAFEADSWDGSFDVKIELKIVFRQSESLLIQLLQGIRKGENNSEHLMLLEGFFSGNEVDPESVQLYPLISDVNMVHLGKLESLSQEIHVYSAKEFGEELWIRQLKSGIAPDELKLCLGARVMLIRNIQPSLKLVNGATGTIVEFTEIWMVIDGNTIVAVRKQIPLILAWALSIHKCQGMSLEKLTTNLNRVFDFGMVSVALSHVRNLAGLRLSGLNPSQIKAHPNVLEFYSRIGSEKDAEKKIQ